MPKHTWIRKNYLSKSHIFPRLDTKPILDPSTLTRVEGNLENGKKRVSSLNNSFVTYQIPIPPSVSFAFRTPEKGSQFIFNSERGSIRLLIPARFSCLVQERIIHLSCSDPHLYAEFRTVIGALYRTLLGVTKGYREKLKTVGMGYKGGVEKNHLMKMVLGYSHPVYYLLDQTTSIKFGRKNNRFNLQGPNHLITYQTAADLHSFKEPDVYKGKGVRYRGFKLLKKEGKKKK